VYKFKAMEDVWLHPANMIRLKRMPNHEKNLRIDASSRRLSPLEKNYSKI
jgi:hypothetical protein